MERKPQDITLYAKYGFIIYVDGYTAQIMSMKPGKDQQGNDTWDFVLNPSDELIKRYNLKPNPRGDMFYKTQISYEHVIQLSADPSWTRYFCIVTYDGKTTPATKVLKGISQQEEIKTLKNSLHEEKLKSEVALERLHLMENNLPLYLKRNFEPLLEQVGPVLDKMMKVRKDEV